MPTVLICISQKLNYYVKYGIIPPFPIPREIRRQFRPFLKAVQALAVQAVQAVQSWSKNGFIVDTCGIHVVDKVQIVSFLALPFQFSVYQTL